MRPLADQARAWQQIYQAQFNENLATFQDNNNPVTVAEMPEASFNISDTIQRIQEESAERVARDNELNRNTVRSYIDRMRGITS